MNNYMKEIRERYEGIQERLSDREMKIFDLMMYVSNSNGVTDRDETIRNLKKKKGMHLAGSTFITNEKIDNSSAIPELEIREVNNLITKLEMWNLLFLPKFLVPFWSMSIYGGSENDWLILGDIYEVNKKDIRKVKLVDLNLS
ncbi:hypothetical protein [Psychrobacillus psychrotolerans]|uniref:hypothetical protein n=1 Tax=Psychrobacillus psychrotolerans TaxID=126156 RepID=UPI0033158E4B